MQQLENQHILVVGDIMLDRYLTGSVSRISPEAPVPVVLHRATEDRLGGAANVALNIRALGSNPVLCSVIGEDQDGEIFRRLLPGFGISDEGLVSSPARRTTVKTRILGNNQQMLRIDQEDTHDISGAESDALIHRIGELMDRLPIRALIFQDYNKGVLTESLIRTVIGMAQSRGILTTVDPKRANFFAYEGVDLFKPNLKEIRDSAPFPVYATRESLDEATAMLRSRLNNRTTMITLSEKGLYLNVGQETGRIYPTVARNIADVSGAGDTVISIATLALAAQLDNQVMAALSNLAGGQVCEFPGVVPVDKAILEKELDRWLHQIE